MTSESRLAVDLGFDSLMLTELSVALEQAGVPLPAVNDLTQVQTVDDLRRLIVASGKRGHAVEAKESARRQKRSEEMEIPVPESVASPGPRGCSAWASARSTAASST